MPLTFLIALAPSTLLASLTTVLGEFKIAETQVAFQAISSTAIAAGLIYTAAQFRKQRNVQHVANFTKLVELQMHLREMRVKDPSLAEVYPSDLIFADGLPAAERDHAIRAYYFNLMQLSVFEIVWFGWKHGQIPDDYFESWERRMYDIVAEHSFRIMWSSPAMKFMHDEFFVFMQQMMDKTPERPLRPLPSASPNPTTSAIPQK